MFNETSNTLFTVQYFKKGKQRKSKGKAMIT